MVRMIRGSEKALFPTTVIVPTLTFGPSSMLKTSLTALVAGDALVSRLHRGELVPVRGEQFLDHHFGARDFCGIELALDASEPTFFSLKASRMSDSVIDLLPLYSMRRMIGRSVT